MSEPLPVLRFNLDFMPSSDPERPGLYVRDPYHYSDASLLIPPPLVAALECFDGQQTTLDLRAELVRITGEIDVGEIEKHIYESLDTAGFLENDRYAEMKRERERQFAANGERTAEFAGSAYPAEPTGLDDLLKHRVGTSMGSQDTVAVAAPHASPNGAWSGYTAAYRALPTKAAAADKTFVVLGTSHYGAPNFFGMTRKDFVTPFGRSRTRRDLVDDLERNAAAAIRMEDYCHAVEHSIEFQIVFLQYLYGPNVNVLPILCGPFVKSVYEGGLPEDDENVARFFDALRQFGETQGNRLIWVLGVDLAHMGQRYGDSLRAVRNLGEMLAVERRDRERLDQITVGDSNHYWSLIQESHDDLKWCGSAPFYTFLRVMPGLRGTLLDYGQWQIDQTSVVSFGALAFHRGH